MLCLTFFACHENVSNESHRIIGFLTPCILFRHSFSQEILNSSYSILVCHLPNLSMTFHQLLVKKLSTIKVQSTCNQYRSLKGTFLFCFLFFYHDFLSHTLAFNRAAGEGRGPFFFRSSIPPTHEHLDIYFVEMSNPYFQINYFVVTRPRVR